MLFFSLCVSSSALVFNYHLCMNTSQSLCVIQPFFQAADASTGGSLGVIIMSRLVSLPYPLGYTSNSTPYFCHPCSPPFPNSELSVLTPFFSSHPTSNKLWNPVCLASAVPPKSDLLWSVIYLTLGTTDVLGWMILCCGDCPMHCSIPGLAPLDAMTFPSCDNQICL